MAENFDIINFELIQEEMDAIRQLDTGTSLFFDHRDRAMVKLLSEAKRNT
jgi:diketogulonate reductase-like aldo/keto reductase